MYGGMDVQLHLEDRDLTTVQSVAKRVALTTLSSSTAGPAAFQQESVLVRLSTDEAPYTLTLRVWYIQYTVQYLAYYNYVSLTYHPYSISIA